jgi:hypothetical protein
VEVIVEVLALRELDEIPSKVHASWFRALLTMPNLPQYRFGAPLGSFDLEALMFFPLFLFGTILWAILLIPVREWSGDDCFYLESGWWRSFRQFATRVSGGGS